jgi:hypothetical protein
MTERATSHIVNHEGMLFALVDSDAAASVRPRYGTNGVPYAGAVMTRAQFDFCFHNNWDVILARSRTCADQVIYIPDPKDARMPVAMGLVVVANANMCASTPHC